MSLLIFSISCGSTASNDNVSNMVLTPDTCTGTLVEGTHTSCSFDTSNWSEPQTITVTINNDAIVQTSDPKITIMASASGGGYDSVSASLPAFILYDDDSNFYFKSSLFNFGGNYI